MAARPISSCGSMGSTSLSIKPRAGHIGSALTQRRLSRDGEISTLQLRIEDEIIMRFTNAGAPATPERYAVPHSTGPGKLRVSLRIAAQSALVTALVVAASAIGLYLRARFGFVS
jgi:hypothetical protein